ncbi:MULTISPECIES: hypothetical protein [unclassified Helicobacter]|uniref:hypothetical protein n=1 Tax=unclassified Helicobacter TaxID=2593540 RepID=UPI000CF0425A|nr:MULTISPECIES: hypothetical protein [unclassified Helicobacter]
MHFHFEITLGEATDLGGVWEEKDVLDFLASGLCSKKRFYKKRKIFDFYIDSNLDDLKECRATHYLKHLQESYLRVVDIQELLLLYSHYKFESELNPIYLKQEGEQVILTYWNDRGRKNTYKVTQAYFYARSINDLRVTLSIDYEGAYRPYVYDILEKESIRSVEFGELCKFLNKYGSKEKIPLKIIKKPDPKPPSLPNFEIEIIDGNINIIEKEDEN